MTDFDRASETLLREQLAPLGFPIVGEEQGGFERWERDRNTPSLFIDPIDGTTNFVHGHPFWCVSVGLVAGGEPVLGVVHAPALGLEWFGYDAADGRLSKRRAWGNARTGDGDGDEIEDCRPSSMSRFEDSLLATGFPYDRRTSAENNFDAFAAIKKRCQAVRRCGSAALDLCWTAAGRYEGYWELGIKPWDMAAGLVVLKEAGGFATDPEGGEPYPSGNVVVGNPTLQPRLRELVAEGIAAVAGRRAGEAG